MKKMTTPEINTAKKVVPIIYCYTTPEIKRHDGWVKIGYSEQEADVRVGQQTDTADVEYHIEWKKNATFDDGSGDVFSDADFHAYLSKCGVERMKPKEGHKRPPEWFHISPEEAKRFLDDFRENRGIVSGDAAGRVVAPATAYELRDEQQEAVTMAKDYFETHKGGKFLFNCKPRFGKTLTVYELIKEMDLSKVLIVTNRPAIANSWYSDYEKFLGVESGYSFVSDTDSLKNSPLVMTRDQFVSEMVGNEDPRCIEFLSLQDLKGSRYFGGYYDKLLYVSELNWDMLVIDEAHEGVDTLKTDVAFDHIRRDYTLHLSGTPFKALASGEFEQEAIYNWTYADEQEKKQKWDSPEKNPYENLPKLNMYTYQMSEIVKDELSQGVEINGETEEYAFDLNEFFATNEKGHFIHNDSVDKFLNALVTGKKYPFSTPELRNELKHTFWLLNRVDSAKALAKKLKKHPVFENYEIVLAAGDGELPDENGDYDAKVTEKSFDRVKEAIATHDKTITISVGQLTTGVTIPEWSAVLMLSGIQSEALYMQAAFRAQNPCLFSDGKNFYRKENAYVFDFDPARTLIIYEKFANNLSVNTVNGGGTQDDREKNIRDLLNFFPVIGEDEDGEMIELDAAKVLSIPRKIKSVEVVKRGFMSDFLFCNISNVFHAPQEVIDMIQRMEPAKDEGPLSHVTKDTASDLDINDDGDVQIPEENVIGTANDMFGSKIYAPSQQQIKDIIDTAKEQFEEKDSSDDRNKVIEKEIEEAKKTFSENVTKQVLETASDSFGSDMTPKAKKELESEITNRANVALDRAASDYRIEQAKAEKVRDQKIEAAETDEEESQATKEFIERMKAAHDAMQDSVQKIWEEQTKSAGEYTVKRVETDKKEKEKRTVEDDVRDHLRGFSRTIPSFLMAYGTGDTTLATFENGIPDKVFSDVTSITIAEFRFLRDGGDYYERDDNGNELRDEAYKKHYEGHLFDEVVFNDSVKEFLNKKVALEDYFDEANEEDIFDYIPPQKTNQIFTPKRVVKEMVDMLEQENPGCFDDPDATFADLYMKSGMYITEIVKRLYNSEKMKSLFPDNADRLNHIFAEQVYGCAPTEIIYRICLSYILGFSDEIEIQKNNIVQCDTLQFTKKGTLEMKLKELFPELSR